MLLCLLVLACASSDQLAQQSDKEMQAGHAQKAYDKAKKALQKDRSNDHARAAMAAAAAQLMRQRQDQITALAAARDTVAAGDRTLDLDAFRRELAEYAVSLAPDADFDAAEHRIRAAAAGIHYRRGSEDSAAGQPKRAYDEFVTTSYLVSGYKNVDERIHSAYEDAVAHIALLPFANETDVRGMSMELADKTYDEVARRINPRDFRFTVLLGRDAVDATIPVAALDHLDRSDAVRFGRELKADQVIVGRFFGLHSQTNTATYRQLVYRRVARKEGEGETWVGRPSFTWEEQQVGIMRRERNVSVQYEFSVLRTDNGEVLANRTATMTADAITVYTDYDPVGSCDDYFLYQPDLEKTQPEEKKRITQEWQAHVGDWKLGSFLEHARSEHEHTTYQSSDRRAFYNFQRANPVFLGDLPPEGDLALVALDRVWEPVLEVLQQLDK
jgi:hypothetical protein